MNFRIGPPTLDFYVDVRLRNFDGRWLAVADIGGDHEIGLARSAREALAGSLSSLGDIATTELLADPKLIGVSRQLSLSGQPGWAHELAGVVDVRDSDLDAEVVSRGVSGDQQPTSGCSPTSALPEPHGRQRGRQTACAALASSRCHAGVRSDRYSDALGHRLLSLIGDWPGCQPIDTLIGL